MKGKLKFYNPMPFETTKLLHTNGRREPSLDQLGYPMFRVVIIGKNHLPAPFMVRDTEAPRKSYYEKITKALLDSNARSQAMAFTLSRECTLIDFQEFF